MLPPPAIRGLFRTDRDDLASLAHWASGHHASLIPRGAGSGMGGGNVGEGVVVDLTALPRRREIDPAARRARTSANLTLRELNAAADPHGLRLPPDPSSGRWATLGGLVSTNAAGARSVRYGSVRRWVESLELVTADGEVANLGRGAASANSGPSARALERFERDAAPSIRAAQEMVASRFPRTRKNSSGYALDAYLASGDPLDLVIGAEGTLGFVTAVEWRL